MVVLLLVSASYNAQSWHYTRPHPHTTTTITTPTTPTIPQASQGSCPNACLFGDSGQHPSRKRPPPHPKHRGQAKPAAPSSLFLGPLQQPPWDGTRSVHRCAPVCAPSPSEERTGRQLLHRCTQGLLPLILFPLTCHSFEGHRVSN